jgi:hypothetical protein
MKILFSHHATERRHDYFNRLAVCGQNAAISTLRKSLEFQHGEYCPCIVFLGCLKTSPALNESAEMVFGKKVVPVLVTVGMLSIPQTATAFSVNSQDFVARGEKIVTHATSTDPVYDSRVAPFFSVDAVTGASDRTCTANNLGNGFWLTAQHCDPAEGDFLQTDEGGKATVTEIFVASSIDDIALVKVDNDVASERFYLPTKPPEEGDELTFIGYGGTHTYASEAQVEVVNLIERYPESVGIQYENLMVVKSIGPSRMCEGDSGGAVYSGDTVHAIHTASGANRACEDGEGALAWLTLLTPERVEWIRNTIDSTTISSPDLLGSSLPKGSSSKGIIQ